MILLVQLWIDHLSLAFCLPRYLVFAAKTGRMI